MDVAPNVQNNVNPNAVSIEEHRSSNLDVKKISISHSILFSLIKTFLILG